MRTVSFRVAALALLLLLALSAAISGRIMQRLPNSVIYFVVTDGEQMRLARAFRRLPRRPLEDHLAARLDALLAGPSERNLADDMVSAIPAGTQVLELDVHNKVVYVNLSSAFRRSSSPQGDRARLYQLMYSLLAAEGASSVALAVEGHPVRYFGTQGLIVSHPWQPLEDPETLRW
ncbi:MAG: GerMN domain-containing protein [Deinococcota bacterium]